MLKDDFFRIVEFNAGETSIKALLELNPAHEIFEGHFPGTPVVPGVCMMQIIKEIVELHVAKELFLSNADSVKFLSVIDPGVNKVVKIDVMIKPNDGGAFEVNASLAVEERVCLKFKGSFV